MSKTQTEHSFVSLSVTLYPVLFQTRATLMNGFKRINPANVEAMQGTAAALAEMSVKEDELTTTAQVKNKIRCRDHKDEIQIVSLRYR